MTTLPGQQSTKISLRGHENMSRMIRLRSTQQDPEGDISTLSGATAVQSPKRPTSRRQPGTAIPPQSPPKSTPTDILMAADKARSKRLIDRQETAVRVSGKHYDEEGSEEEQQQEQQPPRPRVTKSRKRARTPEEDDFDQFEEQPDNAADERAKKRRAIKPVVSATRTQPKQAVTAAVQSVGTRSERPRASQSREVVRSASSEETQPALLKAPLAQPRTKRPWSEKESAHLLKMMEQYGCSWARLKSIDQQDENIFEFRNQDALKDRARNMKIDFLRSGWDFSQAPQLATVALKTADIEKLRQMGRDVPEISDAARRRRRA